MTKLKASNLFDFYTPPNGGSTMADFGNALKNAVNSTKAASTGSPTTVTAKAPTAGTSNVNVASSPPVSPNVSSSPVGTAVEATASSQGNNLGNGHKKDNTLAWVLVGLAVLGTGIYLWHRHKNKKTNFGYRNIEMK